MRQSDRHQPYGPFPSPVAAPDPAVRRVHASLRHLRAQIHADTVAPADLVQPLLDLWAAANECHPWVALPVQHFLAGLSPERSVPASEVASLAEDVNLLLLEVRSLAAPQGAVTAGGTAR